MYGRTRDEAHTKLIELQDKSRKGIPRPSKAKVAEYLDYWLEHAVGSSIRPTTYAKYEQMIRLYLKPGLGRYRLDRLSVPHVQAYLNSRLKGGDSVAKVHVMRMVLGAALTRATREELITRNVARLATLPPVQSKERRPWSADEARRFLDAARGDPLYPAFVLLLVYGLRRGEVLGLSWSDVDFGAGVIRVRQQVIRVRGRLLIGPVKTRAGARELPLLGIARDGLVDQEGRQILGGPATEWSPYGLVFTTANGHPVEPRNLARSFERIARGAKLRPIRLHDLRHVTASLLKKLRVPPRDAMVILGHSRISVTLEIYTHVDEESRWDALDKMNRLLGGEVA